VQPICSFGESLHYSQLEYQSGVFAGVRSNVTFQAEFLSDKLAIMVIDFVEADELYPHETSENTLRKDGVSMYALLHVLACTLVETHDGETCLEQVHTDARGRRAHGPKLYPPSAPACPPI
jgi:hypothetical protein